ncbi:MAG TPA: family 10 glycosylhydrolase, partial [Nitrospira sp.]|nr:family 10 glycosylhydrolase [Nitrospira sp.]
MLSRRQFLRLSAACTASALIPALPEFSHAQETRESRAIFDEGLNWMNPKSANSVCQRIKRAGFNVFMPCVWHGRGTVWPSELAPWDSNNTHTPGYDPLENLLEIAREYDIEIHPWITVGLRQRHFLAEYVDSPTSESFDWHNPAFRNFAVSLIMEVVNRYPIHGINLDFVRFASP